MCWRRTANMGEQWPEQLDRAAKEHGWSEKNLKKHYGELKEPWTLDLAKTARVDLKRLWSSYLVLKRWCINECGQSAICEIP